MAYVISDDCVSCGSCAAECPADAISEGDNKYVIDADKCLDCGTCEATCPPALSPQSNNQPNPEKGPARRVLFSLCARRRKRN